MLYCVIFTCYTLGLLVCFAMFGCLLIVITFCWVFYCWWTKPTLSIISVKMVFDMFIIYEILVHFVVDLLYLGLLSFLSYHCLSWLKVTQIWSVDVILFILLCILIYYNLLILVIILIIVWLLACKWLYLVCC